MSEIITLEKVDLILDLTEKEIEEVENNKDYKENTKYNVDYFSINADMLMDNVFMDKIEEYGAHYFLFFCYLKVHMLNSGRYYIYEKNLKRIIKNYCLNYNANMELIQKIYEELICNKSVFCLSPSCFSEPILVEPYILYNYRLTNSKRAYNRKKQQENRNSKKTSSENENIKDNTGKSAPTAPVDTDVIDKLSEAFGEVGEVDEFF